MAYTFFDSYPDETFRGGKRDFMFSVIAPNITYLHSLKIKSLFNEVDATYKITKDWDIETTWKKVSNIFEEVSI